MAATWTKVTIDVTNVPDKIANVTGTLADGADVRTYSLPLVNFVQAGKTADAIRDEVATALYAQAVADKAKADLVAKITVQEALLLTALNEKGAL